MPRNVADLRKEYTRAGLSESDVDPDPVEQFRRWFTEAVAAPEIVEVTRRLLDKVRAGELGNPPRGEAPAGSSGTVRTGWL